MVPLLGDVGDVPAADRRKARRCAELDPVGTRVRSIYWAPLPDLPAQL